MSFHTQRPLQAHFGACSMHAKKIASPSVRQASPLIQCDICPRGIAPCTFGLPLAGGFCDSALRERQSWPLAGLSWCASSIFSQTPGAKSLHKKCHMENLSRATSTAELLHTKAAFPGSFECIESSRCMPRTVAQYRLARYSRSKERCASV